MDIYQAVGGPYAQARLLFHPLDERPIGGRKVLLDICKDTTHAPQVDGSVLGQPGEGLGMLAQCLSGWGVDCPVVERVSLFS